MDSATGDVPLCCDLNAISAAARPRYNDLVSRLRNALQHRRDLPNGYSYSLDITGITLPEVAEWIILERRCCPFLTFQLHVNRSGDVELRLLGPRGTKAILAQEFPAK